MKFKVGDRVKSISIGYCRRIGTVGYIVPTHYPCSEIGLDAKIFYTVSFGKNLVPVYVGESELASFPLTPLEELL